MKFRSVDNPGEINFTLPSDHKDTAFFINQLNHELGYSLKIPSEDLQQSYV